MSENEAIHTENLTRRFAHTCALDNLTLSVPAGLIFGFLGPNGAGKTTTIRLLLGLLEPDAGHAQVLGYDVQKQAYQVRANVGALLEHTGLYERLSAEDNLEFYGRVWQMSSSTRQQRTRELLSQMGLWERRKETVGTWSKGMKQKLAVARALYHRSKLVFLDEPTNGLDPVAADQLHQTLIELAHNTGLTIFLTTHNLSEAEKLCQLVGVIRQGQLLAYGPPNQLHKENALTHAEIIGNNFSPDLVELLRAQPQVAAVEWEGNQIEVALKSHTSLAPLVTLVVSNGGQVEEVRENKANLEETFLSLMKEERKP